MCLDLLLERDIVEDMADEKTLIQVIQENIDMTDSISKNDVSCSVCSEHFETTAALNTHKQTKHGE